MLSTGTTLNTLTFANIYGRNPDLDLSKAILIKKMGKSGKSPGLIPAGDRLYSY